MIVLSVGSLKGSVVLNLAQDSTNNITATATLETLSSSISGTFQKILLTNVLFTPSFASGTIASGTSPLASKNGTLTEEARYFISPWAWTNGELQLEIATGSATMSFSSGSVAFTGVSTIVGSFSTLTSTSGNVYAGDSVNLNNLIGTWQVVPEPSTLASIAFTFILALFFTTRRRKISI